MQIEPKKNLIASLNLRPALRYQVTSRPLMRLSQNGRRLTVPLGGIRGSCQMKRLAFAMGVLALGFAATVPARADFAVVKFKDTG